MPQHTRLTLAKVEDFLEYLEHVNRGDLGTAGADLFRLLPVLDRFLVKHDRTDLARQLRQAFDRLSNEV